MYFFFSSRRRHTRYWRDWSSDVCSSDLALAFTIAFSELRKVIYTPHIYVINIDLEGVHHTAILKEIQFHPVTDAPLHVDFYEVNDEKPITIGDRKSVV